MHGNSLYFQVISPHCKLLKIIVCSLKEKRKVEKERKDGLTVGRLSREGGNEKKS